MKKSDKEKKNKNQFYYATLGGITIVFPAVVFNYCK